jgi:GH35 family endo-1,4-beta-xylanase
MRQVLLTGIIVAACGSVPCWAINGDTLAMKSNGTDLGTAWRLNDNGYVGTYVTLASPGDVTVTVNAAGAASGGVYPHMNVVINDTIVGFNVGSSSQNYGYTFQLPAGTHFVRTEMNNDPQMTSRSLTVNTLNVAGATVSNSNSSTNALAAANTYIDNYRQGPAEVSLIGATSGTNVHVQLKQHDFNFGTVASGTTSFPDLVDNPTPGSDAYNYQQFVSSHFNSLVPANGGKWTYNEPHRDVVTMGPVDTFLNYAEDHNQRARMHNLIWDTSQQPYWVRWDDGSGLLDRAAAGDATAKEQLRQEIIERIDYYVRDRADQYVEIDVVNESLHLPRYWQVFGASGFAEFFNEVADAVDDAGSNATAMLNEYNVLQWSVDPLNPGTSDPYANWYREHAEEISEAGGEMSGIGVQYYADRRKSSDGLGDAAHSAARIMQAYQNLSVTGLPIALTEFGVIENPGSSGTFDWTWATQIMEETMRMTFGTADATSFMIWDIISSGSTDFGLVDGDYLNPTVAATCFEDLMDEWGTDLSLEVGPDGAIDFTGFYGDYEITINGETFDLSLVKGTTEYSLVVGPALLGDYSGDGAVDAADYTVWRDAMAAGATSLVNEGASPGAVDEDDYLFWKAHFGEIVGGGAGALTAVPEPASLVIWLAALLMSSMARRG